MRKLYVKCNNTSRSLRFSIITSIVEDDGEKYVIKVPAFTEAKQHIYNMINSCEILKATFPEIYVSNVELKGDEAWFEFIEGHSLADEYVECITNNDRKELFNVIKKHIYILKGKQGNECLFYETDKSKEIFGDLSCYIDKKAVKISNFEATAGNILFSSKEERYSFIDYEWVFDFPIPMDIYIYHCVVGSAYWTIPGIDKIITKQDLLKELKIDEKVEEIWQRFIQYVNGNGSNVDFIKMKCLKNVYDIKYLLQCVEDNKGHKNYISLLEADLKKQGQYINELTEDSKESQKYISLLETDLKKQGKYIDELTEGSKESQKYISSLETNLKEQNKYINELTEGLAESQKYISVIEGDNKGKQERIDDLKKMQETQKEFILGLEDNINEQQKYIYFLEKELEEKSNQLDFYLKMKWS